MGSSYARASRTQKAPRRARLATRPQGLSPKDAKRLIKDVYRLDPDGTYTPPLTPVGGEARFDVAFGSLSTLAPDNRPVGIVRYASTFTKPQGERVDLGGGEEHFSMNPVMP